MSTIEEDFPDYSPRMESAGKPIDVTQHALEEGRLDRPLSTDVAPNSVESQIANLYLKAARQLQDDASHRLQTLAQTFSQSEKIPDAEYINGMWSKARSDALRARKDARDGLFAKLARKCELHGNLRRFQQDNRLARAAHYPESHLYHYAIVLVIVMIESVANMYFFAKGSALGMLGGLIQSFLVSIVNVGVAIMIGRFGLRGMLHVQAVIKTCGILAVLGHLIFVLAFNLVAAHYRDLLAQDPYTALEQSLPATLNAPFELSFDSIMLFSAGIVAALLGLFKGYTSDDPYPGYGKEHRRYRDIEEDVAEQVRLARARSSAPIEAFQKECDALEDKAEGQIEELQRLKVVSEKILANYDTRRKGLEDECARHLRHYQEKNMEVRTSKPPSYFGQFPTLADRLDRSQVNGLTERIESARMRRGGLGAALAIVRNEQLARMATEEALFDEFLGNVTRDAERSVMPHADIPPQPSLEPAPRRN